MNQLFGTNNQSTNILPDFRKFMQPTGPGPLTWIVSQNKIWYKLTPFAYNFLVVEKRLLKNLSMLRPQSEYNSLQKVVTKEFRGALYKCKGTFILPSTKKKNFYVIQNS